MLSIVTLFTLMVSWFKSGMNMREKEMRVENGQESEPEHGQEHDLLGQVHRKASYLMQWKPNNG
jgi:hypothetical protein